MAYSVNRKLKNEMKTKYAKNIYVNGIIGDQYQGRKSKSAKIASDMFKTYKQ